MSHDAPSPDQGHVKQHVILLGDVIRFLQDYVRGSWEALRHAELKDPGLGFFALLQKAMKNGPSVGGDVPGHSGKGRSR